ncbi:MAG: beta-xylosidase [Anaerolineae bacterium]|nr:beta-xylosidase [Anaerolineae bacterium]
MFILTMDVQKETMPFPHYWERCVGSGHAALALREDWRRHLKRCVGELGFEYVRFHGLLNDDMSVYATSFLSGPRYSFFNVNSILDSLRDIGVKPFIELSFMPTALASGDRTVFHYKGNITPPQDYELWGELIRRLIAHLLDRYGLDEVRSWFFEVWNEPNLPFFWSGTQDEYLELYRYAALAIKSVDAGIPVGGPSTARNEWIPELKAYCRQNGVPLDFVSTHHYPTDAALGHGRDMEKMMADVPRGVLREMTAKAKEQAGDLPLYYTEWNNSPSCLDPYHDDPYAAAFVVKTIVDNQGLVDAYSYWTFSDIFEEAPFPSAPYHGGFGLLNLYGIPKPTFRAFELLHRLGDERIPLEGSAHPTVEAVAIKQDDLIDVLIYNHNVPLALIEEETVQVVIKGIAGSVEATIERIDADHANPKRRWQELGSPEYPERQVLVELENAAEMVVESLVCRRHGQDIVLEVVVPPHGVACIRLRCR